MGYDERERLNRADARYQNNINTYDNQQKIPARDLYARSISLEKTYSKVVRSGQEASRAAADFYKTPLGKLEQTKDLINKGRSVVGNTLIKLGRKISG